MQTSQKPSGKNKKNTKNTSSSEEQLENQNNPNQKNVAKNDKGKDKPMKFPCKICAEDHLTYKCPRLQECTDFIANKDSRQTPVVLRNPFPNQHQQHQHMVDNSPQPQQRGNGGSHPSGEGPSAIYGMESV